MIPAVLFATVFAAPWGPEPVVPADPDYGSLVGHTLRDAISAAGLAAKTLAAIEEPPLTLRGLKGKTRDETSVWLYVERRSFTKGSRRPPPDARVIGVAWMAPDGGPWRVAGDVIGYYHLP